MSVTFPVRDRVAIPATGAAGALRIDVITDPLALEAVAPAWRALIESSAGAVSVFQTPEWIVNAAGRLARNRAVGMRFATVSDGLGLALVAPLEVETVRGIRILKWLGDPLFEYGDIVARDDVDACALFAAVVARLKIDDHVDLVHLRKVRGDAAVAPWLAGAATALPGAVRAPFADLALPDAGENPDSPRITKADRRKRRRLAEFGELAFSVHRGGAEAEALARAAIALKRRWLDSRGLISRTLSDETCVEAIVAATGGAGSGACVSAFTVGGVPAAIEIGFIRRSTYYSYLAAIEPRFARYSPGRLQLADTIAWCRDSGVARFDLLGTDGEYKERVASGSVAVADWMAPLTVRGTLYGRLVLGLVLPALKSAYEHTPVAARVALKRVATERAMSRGLIGAAAAVLLGVTAIIVE